MARSRHLLALAAACALVAGCGGASKLVLTAPSVSGVASKSNQASQQLGYPWLVTKNTTRVAGADPIADAAAVALAVYPSAGSGTHPHAVVIAPTDNWQASIASSVLMSGPIRAPILLSGSSFPSATSGALSLLAPTGSGAVGGAQVILVGDVPKPNSVHSVSVSGRNAYTLAAGIDRLQSAAQGRASGTVVVASAEDPAYAMPAAGWAAESGDPILFVSNSDIPAATRQALESHFHPHIYVLGPSSVISDGVVKQLGRYGTVNRVGADGPSANSVAFAIYRDPPCASGQPCAHVPGSFGWAMKSPGHGYVLLNQNRPLDAAAAAPLSASGSYGPELLVDSASSLSRPVENFFFDYATPGYTQEGPTAAVYNHGWLIGDANAISVAVQAKVDSDLEPQPVSATSQGPGR
jgi:Cell wall binding domain 2 (CWB2)